MNGIQLVIVNSFNSFWSSPKIARFMVFDAKMNEFDLEKRTFWNLIVVNILENRHMTKSNLSSIFCHVHNNRLVTWSHVTRDWVMFLAMIIDFRYLAIGRPK